MPAPIAFRHGNTVHSLDWGQSFTLPRPEGFRDTSRAELLRIVQAVESGRPWRAVVDEAFAVGNPWLHQIVTSPKRTAFFDAVLPKGSGPVLDVGAGWGQLSRPLAAMRPVVSLEPVAERLAFIRAAGRQDGVADHLACIEADYFELEFDTRFDAICVVGVLEWVGAFQTEVDPQERQRSFLRKARRELVAGGSLVIGIENRIGLKYLLGCPDDHIGVAGVACLPAPLARARWQATTGHELRSFTYSAVELNELLTSAGFEQTEFFAAFPDYKLPEAIVPIGADGAAVNRWLRERTTPGEYNGYNGSPLTPELAQALPAHYRTLANEGVAHAFVPSFFVRAR